MHVDITYEDRKYALTFTVIYFPAINLWLQKMNIDCIIESIKVFEWIESPIECYYAGGYGEIVQKGRRYFFEREDDAVLFRLRWGLSQIDEHDEDVQKYLNTLRRGADQSVLWI